MNSEREKRLSEWYGIRTDAAPGNEAAADGGRGRCADALPGCREPYWTQQCAAEEEPRKKRPGMGIRVAGICVLAVAVIAATALLFSNSGASLFPSMGAKDKPDEPGSMQDYFDEYYDDAGSSEWSASMPRAETGTGVTLTLTPPPEAKQPLGLSDVYERCVKSVVAITTEREGGGRAWGSGIIMTADGYILTNTHVLDGAASATVTLWDDSQYVASLVGADSASDLAVIKITANGLPAAEFCSDTPRVGEDVAAIGNPLGEELRGTMTDGIISAISRDITYTSHPMTLIQTNAAINEGNSGGPLLNMYGQVVGMTSMKLISSYANSSIEGIGFAIPVETIKSVADQLIENGRVLGRPALGVTVGPIPEEAMGFFGIPDGLYVQSVEPASSAAKAGIAAGDVITSVNGRQVTDTAGLSDIIDRLEVGDSVTMAVFRSGKTFEVEVELMDYSELY